MNCYHNSQVLFPEILRARPDRRWRVGEEGYAHVQDFPSSNLCRHPGANRGAHLRRGYSVNLAIVMSLEHIQGVPKVFV